MSLDPQSLSLKICTSPCMQHHHSPFGTCTNSDTPVITYSQPPLPLIRSGRLTGQTMYNSEIWPKIVLFELSLLDQRGGVARAAEGVGTVTSARVKALQAASSCRKLGRAWEGGGWKSPPPGFLPKLRGPFPPFPPPMSTTPNLKRQGPPRGTWESNLVSCTAHIGPLTPSGPARLWLPDTPPGPSVRGTQLSSQASLSQASWLHSPINQLIPQIFTEHSCPSKAVS